MTREQAIEVLERNPAADVRARDVNGVDSRSPGEEFRIWVEDGELVHVHPTNATGTVVSCFKHYYLAVSGDRTLGDTQDP